jgi:CRISPR-associated endonuclease/helicase Cas3
VYTDHPDYQSALRWLSELFQLSLAVPAVSHTWSLVGASSIVYRIRKWHQAQTRLWQELRRTPERKLVAAVKACLIAADVAGSALPRLDMPVDGELGWVRQALSVAPSREDLQRIVEVRLNRSHRASVDALDDQARHTFQSKVAQSTQRVTLVKAGCGTGKTLAAYQWAALNHPGKRLFFCYPTTGTATEGFSDYLFEPDGELGELGARLFHSRRDVDLELLAGSRGNEAECDAIARQGALDTWRTPVAACTVDTVLGLLHNHSRSLFSWPAFAQSVFVFDEIHSYDDTLFGSLLRFLETFAELPVLLMTASLPARRETALQELLSNDGAEWKPILGPERLERRPRYHWSGGLEQNPWPTVCECLKRNEHVLWVCNQVQKCIDVAMGAVERGLTPIVYHSRFRYIDRIQRHREVMNAFGAPDGCLAICTQVAEMSLDLSADLLVTDLAPIPALIQRLGRLNRRASEFGPTKPLLVVQPNSHLPYRGVEFVAAQEWLNRLPRHRISQSDLVEAWRTDELTIPSKSDSAWLDGGPGTPVSDLRDGTPSIPILLPDDLPQVRAAPHELVRYVVPMNFPKQHDEVSSWQRFRMVRIAPTGAVDYDSRWGARWNT